MNILENKLPDWAKFKDAEQHIHIRLTTSSSPLIHEFN